MITVVEKHIGNEIFYEKTISDSSGKSVVVKIMPKAAIINHSGQDYFLLYDSSMKLMPKSFSFLNTYLSDRSYNTKIKSLEALKFLLAFQELQVKSLENLSLDDITQFKYFLHGYSANGQLISFLLQTTRSNLTVNGYIAVYRNFLNYCGISEHPLLQLNKQLSLPFASTHMESISPLHGASYKTNERAPHKFVEVPKYISVDEFSNILQFVRSKMTLRDEIIIRLMYQCGLRIGEVLGLTGEDLVMVRASELPGADRYNFSDKYIPIAYLRNRVSDSKDQLCKSCMKVYSEKQYQSSDYHVYNYGYQFVVLPLDLYDLINDYIEDVHVSFRDSSPQRYYKKTVADSVTNDESAPEPNYYVFLNSRGTPLSVSTWNKVLRHIFVCVHIPIDKDKRKNNLNHRFRHGFAMFNIQYGHANAVKVAELLRHRSLQSVMCYFRPTISDQIHLKDAAIEDMYSVIPELRRTK